ncbi:MarR family winged helix-turn-helix transcriptional regulator [Streptomonospora wellingtoniae]|uniref:MarR family transcriptional regulator n=1 Tax=Streptomonospora wellingtoniae TaxID=3075544 RepID=A0ABU2KQ89_9ACTN|nr:MarR family transcriptional regulator [Streptomonospora sp. DSM 45055]MDT0301440.1 MarR family transcriptional regulator [Streptomonospora sp. DSM 45055]
MCQEDVRDRIGYLVKQVAQAFRSASEERLRGIGLSMAQYAVLTALRDAPGAPAAELARRTFVTRQSLRDVLSGLTGRGLASVAPEPPAGGRAQPVNLTDAGRSLLAEAEAIVLETEARMTAGLSGDEAEQLAGLLRRCRAGLD